MRWIGVDVAVQVAHAQTLLEQVVGEVLGHLLGERGDEDAVARVMRSLTSSIRSSIWPFVGFTMTSGSTSPVGRTICSTTWLLCCSSYVARRGRHEHALVDALEHFLEAQRTVVARARETEAVLDQFVLAAQVAEVLAVQLRHGHVALVDDEQEVVREVVEQGERRLAGGAAVDVHRVVLDAVAVADLLHHLQVVLGAHPQPLRLEQLAVGLEPREPLLQLGLDADDRLAHPLVAGDVVRGREDEDLAVLGERLAGERDRRW